MSSVRSRNRTASNITRSCSEPHQRRNVSRETFPKSPSPEEMPGRAEELSTLFEKRNRRGEHCSPETPPSSLRLATSSVEEALRNRLLFQRRCPAGQRSCPPFSKRETVGANIVRPRLLRQACGLPPPLQRRRCKIVSSHRGNARQGRGVVHPF